MKPLITIVLLFAAASATANDPRDKSSLFDGKDLDGWEGAIGTVWRVEDGAITGGSLEKGLPNNEFLATTRRFENFDLHLQYQVITTDTEHPGCVNGGVQFRSKRNPKNHDMIGYQADLGDGWDGWLYDEGRRNRHIAKPSPEVQGKAFHKTGWNEYRIRCDGPHIQLWLNGVQTVDFTEQDKSVERSGIIALQVHDKGKLIVRYKDISIEELPDSPPQAPEPKASLVAPSAFPKPLRRFADPLPSPAHVPFENGKFSVRRNEVIVFVGPGNAVVEEKQGYVETLLASAFAKERPVVRHMSWEGDTVYEQWRAMNFGGWDEQFRAVGASAVVLWFGQTEALDDRKDLQSFAAAYARLLDEFGKTTRRLVVLSPPPFEKPRSASVPDNTRHNERVKALAEAARKVAAEHDALYVDILTPLLARGADAPSLTDDGIHFTPQGEQVVAELIARGLGCNASYTPAMEPLRHEVIAKNQLWFDCWRTMNWYFAYGDRTMTDFGKAGGTEPSLADELERYKPLLRDADARVHALALNEPAPPMPAVTPEPSRPSGTDDSPEAELKSFKLRDGFEANLFASEADGLVKPLQICWDERGRLWAVCAPSYPQLVPGTTPNDFILICQDTNGAGRADHFSKYAQGLTMPMGLALGDGGAYVCEATELIHMSDTHHDGHADERRVIYSGFGTGDSHQLINSLDWGPDGRLWFTQGLHCFSRLETPWGFVHCERTGIWRMNPRTLRLESFLGQAAATENAWGVGFDDWGQTFYGPGNDACAFYIDPALGSNPTENLVYGQYHEVGKLAPSKTKAMRIEFIGTRHMPDDLQGAMLKCVFLGGEVELQRLHDDGSGFSSEVIGPLISSSSNAFRPVDARVGPDGAIYVCDWYNPIIGHYQASYRDPRRDHAHGRIWRITAKGRPLDKLPTLADMTTAQLLDQLESPQRWVREQAQRLLRDRATTEVTAAADIWLPAALARHPDPTSAAALLCRAITVFAGHDEARPALLDKALVSSEPRLRAFATHMIGLWAGQISDPLGLLRGMIADDSSRVRMEAIVSASYVQSPHAVEVATLALDRPRDRFIDYALTQTIRALAPQWHPALLRGDLAFDGHSDHLRFVLQADGSADIAGQVRKAAEHARQDEHARTALLVLLVDVGNADDLRYALDHGGGSAAVLDELAAAERVRHHRPSGDLAPPVAAILHQSAVDLRVEAIRLAGAWQLKPVSAAIRDQLKQPGVSDSIVRSGLGALADIEQSQAIPLLDSYATLGHSTAVRAAAVAALAQVDVAHCAHAVASLIPHIEDQQQMADLILPILARDQGSHALAGAVVDVLLPVDSAKLALRVVNAAGCDDADLSQILRKSIGISEKPLDYDPDMVRHLAIDALASGDAARGRQLFFSTTANCTACHRVGNQGGIAGPELSSVGTGLTSELIVESILWPNRQIKEGFMLTQVRTTDGRVLGGYKIKETPDEVQLRDPSSNQINRIARGDIAKMKDVGSLMPDGLTAGMTHQELLDLIRYLTGLGRN